MTGAFYWKIECHSNEKGKYSGQTCGKKKPGTDFRRVVCRRANDLICFSCRRFSSRLQYDIYEKRASGWQHSRVVCLVRIKRRLVAAANKTLKWQSYLRLECQTIKRHGRLERGIDNNIRRHQQPEKKGKEKKNETRHERKRHGVSGSTVRLHTRNDMWRGENTWLHHSSSTHILESLMTVSYRNDDGGGHEHICVGIRWKHSLLHSILLFGTLVHGSLLQISYCQVFLRSSWRRYDRDSRSFSHSAVKILGSLS